eukprot:TRINITY_DN5503_c0_g2_i1.p3 TRINITY_DN5503_c0_g2~~TRINITY_DN5503_c0_g2_i1.p3  ORF type:complete len:107 (-),score=10.46 TRINITY_DN5503_c0_g2_i1:138-458(-)
MEEGQLVFRHSVIHDPSRLAIELLGFLDKMMMDKATTEMTRIWLPMDLPEFLGGGRLLGMQIAEETGIEIETETGTGIEIGIGTGIGREKGIGSGTEIEIGTEIHR